MQSEFRALEAVSAACASVDHVGAKLHLRRAFLAIARDLADQHFPKPEPRNHGRPYAPREDEPIEVIEGYYPVSPAPKKAVKTSY